MMTSACFRQQEKRFLRANIRRLWNKEENRERRTWYPRSEGHEILGKLWTENSGGEHRQLIDQHKLCRQIYCLTGDPLDSQFCQVSVSTKNWKVPVSFGWSATTNDYQQHQWMSAENGLINWALFLRAVTLRALRHACYMQVTSMRA